MGTSKNRVVVYARLSRDRTGEETATSRQLAACNAYAKAQGWHIVGTFREADVSGWSRKERPEFEAALQVLRAGEADGLLAWKLDRVGRRVADVANLLEELTDRKQFLASATEPLNTATPMGRAMVGVIAVLAELEAATRSERARAKHAELAKTGRWSGGGRRPFGHSVVKEPGKRAELVINEPESKLLRDAARRVLEGASLSSVVTSWNEQGIETPSGGRWTMADMRRVLLSSQAAGIRIHGEWQTGANGRRKRIGTLTETKGDWPAVLTPATHELLKVKLNDPTRRPKSRGGSQTNARKYPLTGLLICGSTFKNGRPCGNAMVGHWRQQRNQRTYTCSVTHGGCGRVRAYAGGVEDAVLEAAYLRWGELVALGLEADHGPRADAPTPEEEQLMAELAKTENALDKLADDYASGALKMDPRRYNIASTKLAGHIETLTGQLGQQVGRRELTVPDSTLAEEFAAGTAFLDRMRAGELEPHEIQRVHDWVASLVERIVIFPIERKDVGKRFNPDRVHVAFKSLPKAAA